MNGFTVMNPLVTTINEGEEIIKRLEDAADELAFRIAEEQTFRSAYKEALDTYEMAENEQLADVIIAAQLKEGPLAGIAVSGKGYDIVLTNIKRELRTGKLKQLWDNAERTRRNCEAVKVDLEKATTMFNSLRKVAELKTAILKAATI